MNHFQARFGHGKDAEGKSATKFILLCTVRCAHLWRFAEARCTASGASHAHFAIFQVMTAALHRFEYPLALIDEDCRPVYLRTEARHIYNREGDRDPRETRVLAHHGEPPEKPPLVGYSGSSTSRCCGAGQGLGQSINLFCFRRMPWLKLQQVIHRVVGAGEGINIL